MTLTERLVFIYLFILVMLAGFIIREYNYILGFSVIGSSFVIVYRECIKLFRSIENGSYPDK